MSVKDKFSNPLVALVIFLGVIAIAILTTILISRTGSHSGQKATQEALVAPKEIETTKKPIESRSTISSRPQIPTAPPRNVCETPECITLAHQLHNWADPSVDPCVDFYQFTCGKYEEHTVVEGTRTAKKGIIVQNLLNDFLLKNKSSSSKSENAMQTLFNICEDLKDPTVFAENEKSVLKQIFADIQKIGSWPLADPHWDESKFNLNDMLSNLAKVGRSDNGIFKMKTNDSPYLEISPLNERKEPKDSLIKVISKILKDNGINVDKKDIVEAFKDYKDFSKLLDKNVYDSEAEEMEFSELQKQVPSVDFERVINNLINTGRKSLIWDKVEPRLTIYKHPLFFGDDDNLEKLIKKTSKETLANFLILYYIEISNPALSIDEDSVIDRECDRVVLYFLPHASLRVFVRNYFDKENLKLVSDMVEEVRKSFIEMIQESEWLHEETKKNAILKVEKMEKMIGYPEEFEEAGSLDKIFETLNLSPSDSYYQVMNKIRRFITEQTMEYITLETPLNPNDNVMEVNAFYVPDDNYLSVLVPFIDDPLTDSTYPKYANIAVVGATLGHEIGHGFDPYGVTRDENGEGRDWWTPEDSKEYDRRAECLVAQYDAYDDPDFGMNLIGNTTIHEMVADNIGVETSWRLYKKLDLSKEPKVIGFGNYSTDKLFFRLFALDYCASRDTHTLEEVLERYHPTDSFRINGVFSNTKTFAETYNCPVGSPMNPKKKCELF